MICIDGTKTNMALVMEMSCKLMKEIKDKHKSKDDTVPLMQITSETEYIPNHIQNIVECPICKGVFHYHISTENGHISGKCETEKCLTIME